MPCTGASLAEGQIFEKIEDIILKTLTSDTARAELTEKLVAVPQSNIGENATDFLESLAGKTIEKVQENFITIEPSPSFPVADGIILYDPKLPVSSFLDEVYFALATPS